VSKSGPKYQTVFLKILGVSGQQLKLKTGKL